MKIIRVGDRVRVSAAWGQEEPKVLMVTSLERVLKGEKYGWAVRQVFDTDDYVAVLGDGTWAYNWQIKPLDDAEEAVEVNAQTIYGAINRVEIAHMLEVENGREVLYGFILGAWGARAADRFIDDVWTILTSK